MLLIDRIWSDILLQNLFSMTVDAGEVMHQLTQDTRAEQNLDSTSAEASIRPKFGDQFRNTGTYILVVLGYVCLTLNTISISC